MNFSPSSWCFSFEKSIRFIEYIDWEEFVKSELLPELKPMKISECDKIFDNLVLIQYIDF